MNLRIEIDEQLQDTEIIIRAAKADDALAQLKAHIAQFCTPKLLFYKEKQEVYLEESDILFIETMGERVHAHTKHDLFEGRYRLYELESRLTQRFSRIAKATIVNTAHIYAIDRNLTGASQIHFSGTHKSVYVSRHYYKTLKMKMQGE